MAVNPVNLCADLQAWHSAGLSFLYFPGLDARELLRNASRQAAVGPLRATAEQAATSTSTATQAASRPTGASAAPGRAQRNTDEQKIATPIANVPSSVSENTPLPKAWEAVLAKVKPAPVIWTYLELGEDLMVKGDPARREALKELIGGLGLKSGTSAFLPVVLPGCPADGSEGWCFHSLLGRLGGRILVSFGPEALARGSYAALGLEPFQEKIVQGRMLLCLPPFSEILSNPARFEATKVFLRAAFAKINIL